MMNLYPGKLVRHVKRGTLYVVLQTNASLQLEGKHDDARMVVYAPANTPHNETLYIRLYEEFVDGRFENVNVY
jgi:hypothetical protein